MAEKDKKIYLKREKIKVGTGSTAKTQEVENYYQVIEVDESHVECRLLDINDQPTRLAFVIDREELKNYSYCSDYFENKKDPKELMIEKHVQAGDRRLKKGDFLGAEQEYDQVLVLDENHLRANLGKGNTLFAQGKEEAQKIFSKLSRIPTLYEKENKHILNELGIELRQKGMFEEAISNYREAIAIDPIDEVRYYNLARAYYVKRDHKEAINQLRAALKIKAGFKEAEDFLSHIQRL